MSADLNLFDRFLALATTLVGALVAKPLTPEQTKMLLQDMPGDAVRTRKVGGTPVSYVDGWYVLDRLNVVFGFDGWSIDYGTIELTTVGNQTVMRVPGTLRAAGTRKSDIGVAITAGSSPEAFETALKAAYTDALKRCARMLGASLGLALYDKDQRTVGYSLSCQNLLSSLEEADELGAWASTHAAEIDALADVEKKEVRGAYKRRRANLQVVPPVDAAAPAAPPPPDDQDGQNPPLRAPRPAPPTNHPPTAKLRAQLLAATTVAAFEQALNALAPTLAQLPSEQREEMRQLVREQRSTLVIAELTAEAGRVTNAADAKKVFDRLNALATAGKVTQETCDTITEALNERLAMVA